MIRAKLHGADALAHRIRTIQAGLPPLVSRERLGAFLVRRIKDRFRQERDPDLLPWKELSPGTARGQQKLWQKGHLYASIDVIEGNPGDSFGSVTGAGFRIGVLSKPRTEGGRSVDPAVYGRVHQRGNPHVPRRRFIGISRLDVKAVDSLLRREMVKLFKR